MSSENSARYWLLRTDVPDGPFDVVQIRQWLVNGAIGWQTRACLVGQSTWKTLSETPGIGPVQATAADGDRPQAVSSINTATAPARSRPWNPKVIAGLGLLFMPMWAGVMAAINGKRLGSRLSIWLPLGIGFGFLAADFAIGVVVESMLITWVLYFATLAALWFAVLKDQNRLYEESVAAARNESGSWVWPSIIGVPCVLVFLLAFIVAPLVPPDPRMVCENFLAAKSDAERERWTTRNLRPSLSAFANASGRDKHWELLGEEPAPPELGGYLIGYRFFADAGSRRRTEGVFHLFGINGDWKIEEVYVMWQDGIPFEPAIRVSSSPSIISPDARPVQVAANSNQNPIAPKGGATAKPDQKAATTPRPNYFLIGQFGKAIFQSKAAKAIGVGLIALVAAVFRFGRSQNQPAESPAKV